MIDGVSEQTPRELYVRARKVRRIYQTPDGPVHALDGVDFQACRGEIVGVVGRSGSGKTTLLSLIGLLDQVTSGALEIDGRDVSNLSPERLARLRRGRIGFLFQDAGLIEQMSVLNNVVLPLRYSPACRSERLDRAMAALEGLGLQDKARRKVQALSGGERQRVGLARALAQQPALLICDEPSAALDEDTTYTVIEQLRHQAGRGACLVVATHDPLIMPVADRLVRFKAGRISALEQP